MNVSPRANPPVSLPGCLHMCNAQSCLSSSSQLQILSPTLPWECPQKHSQSPEA